MVNPRAKGQRVVAKAIRYALSFPGTAVIPLYQVSRWATKQPFDLIVFRETYWLRVVEVRANAWRTGRASTVALAALPGDAYHKQIWKFENGCATPQIRQWVEHEQHWCHQDQPWEGEERHAP